MLVRIINLDKNNYNFLNIFFLSKEIFVWFSLCHQKLCKIEWLRAFASRNLSDSFAIYIALEEINDKML